MSSRQKSPFDRTNLQTFESNISKFTLQFYYRPLRSNRHSIDQTFVWYRIYDILTHTHTLHSVVWNHDFIRRDKQNMFSFLQPNCLSMCKTSMRVFCWRVGVFILTFCHNARRGRDGYFRPRQKSPVRINNTYVCARDETNPRCVFVVDVKKTFMCVRCDWFP